MDSSDFTKVRRNRVISNSYNGKNTTNSSNKNTKTSSDNVINISIGSKQIIYNNTLILPNCEGPLCNQDSN